mmetsp:Transcript_117268/g.339025  ORF Transcript_117268/g.339025 Transcript_117268/m.339025 type:complete len:370 (+) Transcript_117268:145-1254(+)
MKVIGYIARRRCVGKHLAFADIQVESICGSFHPPLEESSEKQVIQVIFQRDSDVWNKQLDETFPTKNSKLPYGGKVSVDLSDDNRELENRTDSKTKYLVKTWELLENPKDKALAEAKIAGHDGISCTTYLKARGEAFSKFNGDGFEKDPKLRKDSNLKGNEPSQVVNSEFSHGDNRAKALRAQIFASWLIEMYGSDYLRSNGGVLDVAGGKGKLSIELAVQARVRSTIIDPLVRKHGAKLEPRDAKRIRKAEAPHPELVAKPFNIADFVESEKSLVEQAQLLVGLHPDECTEDILDVALRCDKPVAIVPCCVFPGFFPLRSIINPKTGDRIPVRTYEQFLDYLQAKDSGLRRTTLPFEGRNIALYRLPK